ncbi:DUF1918 domain-containing protein [Halobacteriales archaeon QS_8_69_26]|nr:MAG: DUF1918 domain-containing protein [Halobacteriales archaeon QS_8_69_26]
MSFEEGDTVVLNDEHSEYDGQVGTITQVMKTMFDDETYTISFEDGQEAGVPPDQLEEADAEGEDDEAEDDEE